MARENILVERRGRVDLITLNRPRVLNALSPALIDEVCDELDAADRDPQVGAAVITGSPRAFAAGLDVAEMADQSPVGQLARDQTGSWARISAFTKPLLAAVNGFALGGGCELALACDLIVAGDNARFGQPEINLGVMAGAGGTQRWTHTAGKYVAMEINLLGAQISAQRAYQLGIVNRVVPAEVTVDVAVKLAERAARQAPIAVRLIKESVNRALESPLSEGMAHERKNFYFLFATEDQSEGMAAFADKRAPEFKGR
jgi:enoyl-CoA hydratase